MNIHNTKIILVDDDADDIMLFCEALATISQEIVCRTAGNGKDFFEALEANIPELPDVIFLDINMPIMNGWECLKTLKESPYYKDIPTIMYSTSGARNDVELAYSLGASMFITKPDDFKDLCHILALVTSLPEPEFIAKIGGLRQARVL